jgi:hypothetical protein
MSNQRVENALLEGFSPPIFPGNLRALRKTMESTCTTNGLSLETVGKRIKGFVRMDRPTTSDGYTWFWGLNFICGETNIAILIPWWQDFNHPNGDTSDRSIAVYTKGKEDEDEVTSLIAQLRYQMYVAARERKAETGHT